MTNPNPGSPLWPANFQGCAVTAQYLDLSGQPIVGTVTFTASPGALQDQDAFITIVPKVFTATLDVNGRLSITLPATDDPDINPSNWTYAVSENFSGGRKYNIQAPQNQTIDLVNVSPVPASNGQAIVRGPRGAAGGIQMVNGKTGDIVVLGPSDVGADAAGAAAAAQAASLQRSNNLSDLASPSVARSSLGLTAMAQAVFGDAPGTVMQGGEAAGGDLTGNYPNPQLAYSGWTDMTSQCQGINLNYVNYAYRFQIGPINFVTVQFVFGDNTNVIPVSGNVVNTPLVILPIYGMRDTPMMNTSSGPGAGFYIQGSGGPQPGAMYLGWVVPSLSINNSGANPTLQAQTIPTGTVWTCMGYVIYA